MADFTSCSAAFLSWFNAIPGTTIHPALSLRDLRASNTGRGLVATDAIPVETVLFTIPRDAILSVGTSELPKKVPGLFAAAAVNDDDDDDDDDDNDKVNGEEKEQDEEEDEKDGVNPWSSLIFVMIYEYLRGEKSKWKSYFDILPTDFDTPMFWSDEELSELQASPLRARIGKEEAEKMFKRVIVPGIQANKEVFYEGGGVRELSEEEIVRFAHRMGSTIMAYAFDLERESNQEEDMEEDGWVVDREDEQTLGMVPMADMMNADAEFNAHVNHGDKSLTVTALRPIAPGEEILNYYGPHPNSELLRKYGYVTSRHSRYDVVEIPFSTIRTAIQSHLKLSDQFWLKVGNFLPSGGATAAAAEAGDDDGMVPEAVVIERNSGFPGADGLFQGPADLEGVTGELEEVIAGVLKAVKKVSAAVVPDKRKREEISGVIMRRVVEEGLKAYPTTLEEDEGILNGLGDDQMRKRMAVVVRMGEKKLLREILEKVNGGGEDEPSSKRVK